MTTENSVRLDLTQAITQGLVFWSRAGEVSDASPWTGAPRGIEFVSCKHPVFTSWSVNFLGSEDRREAEKLDEGQGS